MLRIPSRLFPLFSVLLSSNCFAWNFTEVKVPYFPKFYERTFDKFKVAPDGSQIKIGELQEQKLMTHDGIVSSQTDAIQGRFSLTKEHRRTDYPIDNLRSNEQYIQGINESRKVKLASSETVFFQRFTYDAAGLLLSTSISNGDLRTARRSDVFRDGQGRIAKINYYLEGKTESVGQDLYTYDDAKETVNVVSEKGDEKWEQIFDKKSNTAVADFELASESAKKGGRKVQKEKNCSEENATLVCDETTIYTSKTTKKVEKAQTRYVLVRRVITNRQGNEFYKSVVLPLFKKTSEKELTWNYDEHYQVVSQITRLKRGLLKVVSAYDADGDFVGRDEFLNLGGKDTLLRTSLRP